MIRIYLNAANRFQKSRELDIQAITNVKKSKQPQNRIFGICLEEAKLKEMAQYDEHTSTTIQPDEQHMTEDNHRGKGTHSPGAYNTPNRRMD